MSLRVRAKRMLGLLVGTLALAWCAIAVAVFVCQERLMFPASRVVRSEPAHVGLAFEPWVVATPDGETLDGWWVPAPSARATVLFFHGNAGNIADRLDTVGMLHRLGLSVALLDYRGYGRSTGSPSEEGLIVDAKAAYDDLLATHAVAPERLLIMGRSLGGAVAVALATERRAAGLVIESTFTSMRDMAALQYPWLPTGLLLRHPFDSLQRIRDVDMPLWMAASPDDRLIPAEHGAALFAVAREPKTWFDLRGDHNETSALSGSAYRESLSRFVDAVAPSRSGTP